MDDSFEDVKYEKVLCILLTLTLIFSAFYVLNIYISIRQNIIIRSSFNTQTSQLFMSESPDTFGVI